MNLRSILAGNCPNHCQHTKEENIDQVGTAYNEDGVVIYYRCGCGAEWNIWFEAISCVISKMIIRKE